MSYGYHKKIIHINLSLNSIEIEEPEDSFYRKYMGGSAMGTYYLLKNSPPGADPLGEDNTFCMFPSVLTGVQVSGLSRINVTAKSPLSGLIGDSQAGGFFPAEFKRTGFDGIVVTGKSQNPVYIWIHDGEVEIKDAIHLWGKNTAEVEDIIRDELGDKRIQVAQCGIAAEKGVLFSCIINNANRAHGRTGMGTVMAAKNLKAIAVRGNTRIEVSDPESIQKFVQHGVEIFPNSVMASFQKDGTAGGLAQKNTTGFLPSMNWSSGFIEGIEKQITGTTITETILKKRDTCFACIVRCKRVVEINEGKYKVDPRYGGPEYETLAMFGSYCGVTNLSAISYANQLCNQYGVDTMTCGGTIA
jgi:aldehyde:ferredoxin oxidoreductase